MIGKKEKRFACVCALVILIKGHNYWRLQNPIVVVWAKTGWDMQAWWESQWGKDNLISWARFQHFEELWILMRESVRIVRKLINMLSDPRRHRTLKNHFSKHFQISKYWGTAVSVKRISLIKNTLNRKMVFKLAEIPGDGALRVFTKHLRRVGLGNWLTAPVVTQKVGGGYDCDMPNHVARSIRRDHRIWTLYNMPNHLGPSIRPSSDCLPHLTPYGKGCVCNWWLSASLMP